MAGKVKKGGLGQGLGALIPQAEEAVEVKNANSGEGVQEILISLIEPNDNQPRKTFDKEQIQALAESIKEHGIIQPIIVTANGSRYTIIAGERRWRAAREAGMMKVPVIVREATPREVMELALIENIQRQDLNPIEEAEAYERLMKEYNITQENLSRIVSKSRPAIANSLRLLGCDKEIREMLISGKISAGHGRAILQISEKQNRIACAKAVLEKGLSVRDTELLARKMEYRKEQKPVTKESLFAQSEIDAVENKLKNALGTKVNLLEKNGKGKIVIRYFTADERERLIEYLTKNN